MLITIYKVFLEYSCAPSFLDCQWLLWCCNGRVEQLQQRLYGLQSPKYLLTSPLQKKNLPGVALVAQW